MESRSSPPSGTASASVASTSRFETVVLRYFNVYGPRQSRTRSTQRSWPLFIAAIDQGEPVTIHGDGEQSRDFTYVTNAVDATIRAAEGGRGERTRLQRRRRLAGEREPRRRRNDRPASRQAGREALRAASARRHPGLLGRHLGGTRSSRIRAAGRPRRRAGAHGRGHRCPRSEQPVKILRVIAGSTWAARRCTSPISPRD